MPDKPMRDTQGARAPLGGYVDARRPRRNWLGSAKMTNGSTQSTHCSSVLIRDASGLFGSNHSANVRFNFKLRFVLGDPAHGGSAAMHMKDNF